jgi:hypothetical protein
LRPGRERRKFRTPDESGFCSSETKHDRRRGPKTKMFVSAKRLQEKGNNLEKVYWVLTSVRVASITPQISVIAKGGLHNPANKRDS